MPSAPSSVVIRSFQVGFGDCFLLSFVYGAKDTRHVLIDFGTTALPRGRKPSVHMPKIAQEIKRICGDKGRLTAVVATHRHKDHISGFGTDAGTGASGDIIRDLRPKLVLQPWTEDPKAQPNAKNATGVDADLKGFVAALADMNALASRVRRLAASAPQWMGASVREQLEFLGSDNIANRSAVDNLIEMGNAPGAKARYLRYGSNAGLGSLLPGVKVHVLGPPDLTQTEGIRKQRAKDAEEFWHLISGVVPAVARSAAKARKRGKASPVPIEGRWFRDRLESLTGQGLLEIVRQLDSQMNNTSVILLFEVFGKKLLFPGDAQLENWSYALQDAPDTAHVQRLLEDVDFYKVGHHGSLNATPRKLLWERFKKRKGRELLTMLSTMHGKHGHTASKTEVPRRSLVAALNAGSRLKTTQKLTDANMYHELEITP